MEQILEKLQEFLAAYGLKIVGSLVILLVGWIVAKILRKLIVSILEKAKCEQALVSFVSSLSYAAIMTFVIIAAIAKLGVQTATFVAVIGAAGLAVGLALQGSLANFAAGVLVIIFKPFKAGDFVEVGGAIGVVKEIEIFTTTLTSTDNKTIIIPNAKLTGDNIINYSTQPNRRVDLVVGVSYGDDLDKTQQVIMDVLKTNEYVLEDPAPNVAVSELADSSVNLVVRPWVKSADYWDAYFSVTKAVKQRLDAEGISIPFPQRDVHIYQSDKSGE